MTMEYSSPPFINAVPLGPSSLEGTLLVRSIQTSFFPGSHCISVPQENGAKVLRTFTISFADGEEMLRPNLKKAKVGETTTEGSVVSTRVQFLHCVHWLLVYSWSRMMALEALKCGSYAAIEVA